MSEITNSKALFKRMLPRNPHETHRPSTSLELLFDLVFVTAVALAAARLHHSMVEGHLAQGLLSYVMVFFAIWWAWMGFSWFASAYDVDDVPYRLMVFVQLAGALVVAAGVPSAFDAGNFLVLTIGFVIMRLAQIGQWMRAWRSDVARRKTIGRYIKGLSVVQLGWVALLFVPAQYKMIGFCMLAVLELLVPSWAESAGFTSYHPEHIVERYGLFTIIVLGESILSSSNALQTLVSKGQFDLSFVQTAVGAVLIVFTMWWNYFQQTEHDVVGNLKTVLLWGYGHFFIFAAVAAVGAGLSAHIDLIGVAADNRVLANAVVVVPVLVYELSLGVVHRRFDLTRRISQVWLLNVVLMVASIWTDSAVLYLGLLMMAFLGFKLWYLRAMSY